MQKLKYRQIHLDFHTGEKVPDVGKEYSNDQFADMLKKGHINSINLFAKCHHGWFYYFDTKFAVHPTLKQDLLPMMIDTCEKNNVSPAVYISAGIDENMANLHPEWISRDPQGKTMWTKEYLDPGFRMLCFNTPYLDVLKAQTEEVVTKFKSAVEIFFDICDERICFCPSCLKDYEREGIDLNDYEALAQHAKRVYHKYYTEINDLVHRINPEVRIFHNMGNIVKNNHELINTNTHAEIESLSTGAWGYDYFPLNATYIRQTGMDFVGHAGKFHTAWGDYGGYKHSNSLIYETGLHVAFGGKSLVGDQLHPSGKFDSFTYESIGKAFSRIEALEPWLDGVKSIVDVGIISQDCMGRSFKPTGDIGASRILLQGHYLFDLIDMYSDFSKYKVIILPDTIEIDPKNVKKLQEYLNAGGKLLASGISGTTQETFPFDLGSRLIGKDSVKPTFVEIKDSLKTLHDVNASMYEDSYLIEETGKTLLWKVEPYAKRTVINFSSHLYNPYGQEKHSGVTQGKDGIYICWEIFKDYYVNGSIWAKEIVLSLLDTLIGNRKQLLTDMPSCGIVTLFDQCENHRLVNHMLYGVPVLRGNVQVIEDLIPVRNVQFHLKTEKKILKVSIVPQNIDVPFTQNGNDVTYTVAEILGHAVVSLEY